ncbi:cytochrome d ubiquinol oxidase subunit II [Micromonospora sp. BRA006-A]|nr:cytochrome d ubiquinol oxidase subunit II [Micromonospora sp. BRA006-A]
MELAWYALLGLFFATYLVLGGYDYGVGLLLARRGPAPGSRATLTALGPFFLGNEVWLVAAVGILFGAFPGWRANCSPASTRRCSPRWPVWCW